MINWIWRPAVVMLLFTLFVAPLTGQIVDPVDWTFSKKSLGNNEFELQFTAAIDEHWHVYSMDLPPDGPIPTSFSFLEKNNIELIGEVQEPKGITIQDKVFMMELTYFENTALFTQKVKLNGPNGKISGELEYMACDDAKCTPPEYVEFTFDLKAEQQEKSEQTTGKEESSKATEKPTKEEHSVPTEKKAKKEAKSQPEPSTPSMQPGGKSQIVQPVKWKFSKESVDERTAKIVLTATLDEGWHLYSLDLPPDDGPIPTSINFSTNGGVELKGDLKVIGELKKEYDPNFMLDLAFYEHEVSFIQEMNLEGKDAALTGEIEFMVCNDRQCLPPEVKTFEFTWGEGAETPTPKTDNAGNDGEPTKKERRSYLGILLIGILGGLGALLTPCVFPMIPMTVSFFTKQSKTYREGVRKGLIYGASIIGIYVLLSLPFHLFDSISPDIFNQFSTNPYLNILFFLIFIVFAISFLGAFEIVVPNSWVTKADQASDKGGLLGIFFMALTLILVSFSCTGPAIGLLLGSVLSTDGGATALSFGMLGFGLGLGLPFGLFAAFPGWMNTLPKSGGWLNVVKVSFGFLELAFAFKFLSNADLVTQAGLLYRELFIAIWIGVFLAWALYMFGLYRLPHDSPVEKISVGRGVLATFLLVFVFYLLPGLWGAPLKLISGFPPPMFYSESPNGVGNSSRTAYVASSTDEGAKGIPEGADPDHCPHGLPCFHDYQTGLDYAKQVNKPVMLDFTGWACVNCRRMEENVWSDPRVLKRLRNDVVLISLYVDEREKLPEDERYVSEATGKKIRTVGNKWSDFQISEFQSNTQPYYVFVDHEGNQLHESASYDPSIPKFIEWLDSGVEAYNKNQ